VKEPRFGSANFIGATTAKLPPTGSSQSVRARQRPQSVPKEPSQTTNERLAAHLGDALASLGDRAVLNTNPLSRTEYVQRLASEKYADKLMPRGLALRQVITECVARICAELGDEPGLAKPCRYLDLRAKGLKCTEVAAQLGLAREHVSRTIRPRALGLLLEEFLSVTGRRD
jgi:hypothetical protein